MTFVLQSGRNDLAKFIERGIPLEELLIKGRVLESDFHDGVGCRDDHMHWHKKVLGTYDPKKDVVLLSKQGSRRLISCLDEPDREYSKDQIYKEALEIDWKLREIGHQLS